MKRALDRSNPWGLTVREVAVHAAVVETGSHAGAAEKLGIDERSVENAMARGRKKMGVDNAVHQLARWVEWTSRKYADRPRTAWVCPACTGLGFLTRRPA